jgi:uncharacterized protein YndB with AHSA1/START domain
MGDEQDLRDRPTGVTQCVDLDADLATVWQAVADPERRRQWLDDEDAQGRLVHVEHVDEGRLLSWTWWRPGDEDGASRVDVQLTELDGGGTRVLVHERLLLPGLGASVQARSGLRAQNLWGARLFGLELLVAAAGALVA